MYGREPTIWAFSLVFYLLFFLPAIFSALGKIQERLFENGSVVLVPAAFAFIYWMTCYAPANLSILFLSAVACLSFYFSHYLNKEWNKIQNRDRSSKIAISYSLGFTVMLFVLMCTLLRSVSMQFGNELNEMVIFTLLEGCIAVAIGCYVFRSQLVSISLALYFLVPWSITLFLILFESDHIYNLLFSLDFPILWTGALVFSISAWIVYGGPFETKTSSQPIALAFLGSSSILFTMSLIWKVCSHLFPSERISNAVALIVFIIASELLIYMGNFKQLREIRLAGIAVLLFVIYRLLFIEAWEMQIAVRTITFVIAGVLLMGTAFFDKKCVTA
jgi:hypothetical protein